MVTIRGPWLGRHRLKVVLRLFFALEALAFTARVVAEALRVKWPVAGAAP